MNLMNNKCKGLLHPEIKYLFLMKNVTIKPEFLEKYDHVRIYLNLNLIFLKKIEGFRSLMSHNYFQIKSN